MTQNVATAGKVLAFGAFRLFFAQRVLMEGDRSVRIGSRALEILFALLESPGEVVTKNRLMARIWPDVVVEEGTLRVHISALRKVLGEGHSGVRYVENVTGHGYRFIAPVTNIERTTDTAFAASVLDHRSTCLALTRMIGRAQVVAALVAHLPKRRFVTIAGPGGIGKTTVALATADRLRSSYADGIHCVDLTSIRDSSRVASAVASALRLPVLSADPLPNLVDYVAHKQMLLVMDNCEHVVESAALVAEAILRRAPDVHIIATSREPLRAEGEWVQRLQPLELPAPGSATSAATALGYSAIQLFVERALASSCDFELQDDEVPLVVEICRKLDGLPLAIELAAACVDLFGLRSLAARLDDRLQLLRSGRRTALPRHKTLRATLDWSYEILSEPEQKVLQRLSVFAGSFNAASANAVAAAEEFDENALFDHLNSLVAKSLLVAQVTEEEVQYRLLDTTRAYALEKLEHSGESSMARRRHAQSCCGTEWSGTEDPAAWLVGNQNIDDVRAALDWCFSVDGDACLGVKLIASSAALWFRLSCLDEYGRRVDRALQVLRVTPAHEPRIEMQLSAILGEALLYTQGPSPRVVSAFNKALELGEQLGNNRVIHEALWGLHSERIRSSDYVGALDFAERWRRAPRDLSRPCSDATGDRMLALAHHLNGDQSAAREHAEAILRRPVQVYPKSRYTGLQFDDHVAALAVLARILWIQGFPEQAVRAGMQAVDRAIAIDHGLSICHALGCAATVELWAGNRERARELAATLTEHSTRNSLGHWQHWAWSIEVAATLGEGASSAQILATAVEDPSHTMVHLETLGTFDASLASDAAIARAEQGLAGWCAPEMIRLRAISLREKQRSAMAETMLQSALTLAHRQGALSWELRTAMSLARLWSSMNRGQAARELLCSVLDRFTEGLSTADVVAARALLDELSIARTVARSA